MTILLSSFLLNFLVSLLIPPVVIHHLQQPQSLKTASKYVQKMHPPKRLSQRTSSESVQINTALQAIHPPPRLASSQTMNNQLVSVLFRHDPTSATGYTINSGGHILTKGVQGSVPQVCKMKQFYGEWVVQRNSIFQIHFAEKHSPNIHDLSML